MSNWNSQEDVDKLINKRAKKGLLLFLKIKEAQNAKLKEKAEEEGYYWY